MRKTFLAAAVALVVMVSAGMVLAQQQGINPGQGYGQGWHCPWAGQGMGPGMMHRGPGMGPGMMHGQGQSKMQGWHGRGMGPGMMHGQWGRGQYGPNAGPQQMQPLDKSAARNLAQNYAAGNPNLKIGQVTEQDGTYEATIVTQDGSLVEKLLIDKQSGWMKRAF